MSIQASEAFRIRILCKISHLISYSDIGHPGFETNSANQYRRSNRLSQYLQVNGFYAIQNGLSMSHSLFINTFKTNYYNRSDTPIYEIVPKTIYDDINFGLRSELIYTQLSRWIIMLGYDYDWSKTDVDVLNQQYNQPQK